mmetsp:Transcript_4073/g.9628  ORF Transcript_4073/g.9628 Transcript_4073/m.9628 type:complete len:448 (-) Transcript_4073:94-1437(-)|eukprot:CAMPEP_0170608170 /NCGR_PEP_ID=MMETSP0224-20130122/21443_1 /TAXON_ID=285029 /ORGANISM="Togula jolla, Strain CCCM 725" /LENGTH=447 /DNA_ID=CAMNT_0010933381 /DNA_START=67 /DNA_END=1410 /DNA_ORIENTATION=-
MALRTSPSALPKYFLIVAVAQLQVAPCAADFEVAPQLTEAERQIVEQSFEPNVSVDGFLALTDGAAERQMTYPFIEEEDHRNSTHVTICWSVFGITLICLVMILLGRFRDMLRDPSSEMDESTLSTIIGLSAILLIALGVGLLMYELKVEALTALYVVMQLVTTVGYGDFLVETDIAKIVMACYVIINLVVVAYAWNQLLGWVAAKRAKAVAEAFRLRNRGTDEQEGYQAEVVASNKHNLLVAGGYAACVVAWGTIFFATYEGCTCSYGKSYVKGCVEDTYDHCVLTGGYQKSWAASFYMAICTLTTVGFGDHSPRSRLGRALGMWWMLLGVMAMANLVEKLSAFFFSEQDSVEVANTKEELEALFKDSSSNGTDIDKNEFTIFMLQKSGLVDPDTITVLREEFTRLVGDYEKTATMDDIMEHTMHPTDSDARFTAKLSHAGSHRSV